jgi:hypothetical protein
VVFALPIDEPDVAADALDAPADTGALARLRAAPSSP